MLFLAAFKFGFSFSLTITIVMVQGPYYHSWPQTSPLIKWAVSGRIGIGVGRDLSQMLLELESYVLRKTLQIIIHLR